MQAINANPPTTPPTIPPKGSELVNVVPVAPGGDRLELVAIAVVVTLTETDIVPGGFTSASVATGMLRIS